MRRCRVHFRIEIFSVFHFLPLFRSLQDCVAGFCRSLHSRWTDVDGLLRGLSRWRADWFSVKASLFFCLYKCEALVTTGASAIQQPINQSINQLISPVTFQVHPINQSINSSVPWHFKYIRSINQSINQSRDILRVPNQSIKRHFRMSFLFGFETFSGFYSFLHVSWYISGVWLDGMSGGVVGMRELSAWPREWVYLYTCKFGCGTFRKIPIASLNVGWFGASISSYAAGWGRMWVFRRMKIEEEVCWVRVTE